MMPVARLGGGPRRVSVTGPPPRFRYWAVHRVSVTVGLYHVSDTALRSYFRYQTVDRVSVTGSSTAFSMPCPNGASHTSPGCKPWESHPEKETRVRKERRIVAGLGLRPRPSLCGVPSEHTDSLGCGSQGDALGWYALPRWGKWDDRVSDPAFDRCGPKAKCESRGQRAQLQWRRRRLDGGFGCGFSVAGVADPGAARSVKRYRIRRSRRASRRTFF